MPATKSRPKSTTEAAPEPEAFLTAAARIVGHAAGQAAVAIGLEHTGSAPAEPKMGRSKTRLSARGQRKNQAAKAKSAAENLLSKSSPQLDAPYRRVMGKPAANWSDKDIAYVNGLLAKQSA